MIGLLLTATLATGPDGISAVQSERDLVALAEKEYRAGLEARADSAKAKPHFQQAALACEELWQMGIHNPPLARNMAQAWLLAGNLARAIRAYHLGQRVAPHDSEIHAGLAYARDQVRYPGTGNLAEEARYRDRRSLLRHGPAWLFGAIAAGIYLFALLSLARGWMSRRPIWWVLGGILMFVGMMLAGSTIWEDKHLSDEKEIPLAIVGESGAALHRGNGVEFPLRIAERLPEGVEVIILAERGGWLQVVLARGTVGWVDARQVIRVE